MSTPVGLERVQFSLHAGRKFQANHVGETQTGHFNSARRETLDGC